MDSFLKEKAQNFQAFLKLHNKNTDAEAELNSYKEEELMPTILTVLIPLYAVGQLETAVDKISDKFLNESPEFKDKVRRYLNCFVEVVSAAN